MFLHLTTVDDRKIWLNSNLISALGPSITVENATWIDIGGEEFHVRGTPEEILEQIKTLIVIK